jgi:hypothetical protein
MSDILDNAWFFVFNKKGEQRCVTYADYQTYLSSGEWYKSAHEAVVENEKDKTRDQLKHQADLRNAEVFEETRKAEEAKKLEEQKAAEEIRKKLEEEKTLLVLNENKVKQNNKNDKNQFNQENDKNKNVKLLHEKEEKKNGY